jgi:hypothetical protein
MYSYLNPTKTQMIRNINSIPPTEAIGITTSTEIFISFIIENTKILKKHK